MITLTCRNCGETTERSPEYRIGYANGLGLGTALLSGQHGGGFELPCTPHKRLFESPQLFSHRVDAYIAKADGFAAGLEQAYTLYGKHVTQLATEENQNHA